MALIRDNGDIYEPTVEELIKKLRENYGIPENIANMLPYFYFAGYEWHYDKSFVTEQTAKALVEKAQAYNKKLYTENTMEDLFKQDMQVLEELERNRNITERFFMIRAKDSGAFYMRLWDYYASFLEGRSGLGGKKRDKGYLSVAIGVMGSGVETEFLNFATYYSHWFDNLVE